MNISNLNIDKHNKIEYNTFYEYRSDPDLQYKKLYIINTFLIQFSI